MRPGIKPASSWILVGFVTADPKQDLLGTIFMIKVTLYEKKIIKILFKWCLHKSIHNQLVCKILWTDLKVDDTSSLITLSSHPRFLSKY